ncbi:MAG: hypothetical protein ACRERD_09310 [Candidatus Binatia bacterium]
MALSARDGGVWVVVVECSFQGVVEWRSGEEEPMGVVLEVEVPQEVFSRRIQPFGIALAEVSWRVKMFTHEGVVLAALYLQEPDLIIALSFWPDEESARRFLKRTFEIGLCAAESPPGRVCLRVQLDAAMVDELFMAASLVNPRPGRINARRGEKHFADFLTVTFPDTSVVWARAYHWREAPRRAASSMPIRVG